jgi:hypothetical protein
MADPITVIIRFTGEPDDLLERFEKARRRWIEAQDGDHERPLFYAACRTDDGIAIVQRLGDRRRPQGLRSRDPFSRRGGGNAQAGSHRAAADQKARVGLTAQAGVTSRLIRLAFARRRRSSRTTSRSARRDCSTSTKAALSTDRLEVVLAAPLDEREQPAPAVTASHGRQQ